MGRRGRGMASGLRTGPLTSGGRRREELSPHAKDQLASAHGLATQGKDTEAADAFSHLAAKLNERGDHAIAMHLQLAAARALGRIGRPAEGVQAANTALSYATQGQIRQKATRKVAQLAYELRDAGHGEAAEEIEAAAKEKLGVKSLPTREEASGPTINRAMRRSLPKRCPTCAMPIDPDRLEVSDDALADCGYCGTPVMA